MSSTLVFAVSSIRHENPLLAIERRGLAAAEQGGKYDDETTVACSDARVGDRR